MLSTSDDNKDNDECDDDDYREAKHRRRSRTADLFAGGGHAGLGHAGRLAEEEDAEKELEHSRDPKQDSNVAPHVVHLARQTPRQYQRTENAMRAPACNDHTTRSVPASLNMGVEAGRSTGPMEGK
eukprot:84377-Rhodomonas_salina.1